MSDLSGHVKRGMFLFYIVIVVIGYGIMNRLNEIIVLLTKLVG
jgi:hypothetical protein